MDAAVSPHPTLRHQPGVCPDQRPHLLGGRGGGLQPTGAQTREQYRITAHSELALPNARAINALTGTNWEGVGVTPDIAVPQEEALRTAYRAALKEALARREGNLTQPSRDLVEEARTALRGLEEASER